jgi:adenine-specific DNA-methyltransferase
MWRGLMPPKGRHWRSSPDELDRLDRAGLIEWSSKGNPRRIIYADDAVLKGKKMQDVWTNFKDHPYPGYPTEKNFHMLQTIVQASSKPGDVVLDCFCGSGTTLAAAESLNRRWIGIDESRIAIEATTSKLSGGALLHAEYQLAHLDVDSVASITA